jgi:hypothetical protein
LPFIVVFITKKQDAVWEQKSKKDSGLFPLQNDLQDQAI